MTPEEHNIVPNDKAEINTIYGTLEVGKHEVVSGIFFLSNEAAAALDDPYISNTLPHYLMVDGTVRYGKKAAGGEMGMEVWWEVPRDMEDYKENGYGPKER